MTRTRSSIRATCTIALLSAAGAGCSGGASLWPFGDSEAPEISRKPANATEYRCEGGATLYLRQLAAGGVWLFAPDRELRLDKKAEGRYGYGRVELVLDKDRLDFTDPPAGQVTCLRPESPAKK